jgi:hypothetical protein
VEQSDLLRSWVPHSGIWTGIVNINYLLEV